MFSGFKLNPKQDMKATLTGNPCWPGFPGIPGGPALPVIN